MPYKNIEDRRAWAKRYKAANKDKLNAAERVRYALNIDEQRTRCRKNAQENALPRSIYQKNWRKSNPDKHNAKEAKRRASKLNQTPKWLTKEQHKQIEEFYTLAKELQWLSEESLEVDHVVPLQGKDVRGLHVPWNLQILPKSMNTSKGNRRSSY